MKLSFTSIACIALVLTACTSKNEENKAATEELPQVKTLQVFEQDVPQIAEYTATVEAFKTNNISSASANRIKRLHVEVGSLVKAGQVLATLDNVNIDQAKLRINNQKRELDRAKELLAIGGGTQSTVDQLQTEYDAALRSYNHMVENTVLTSPMSGIVTARNYDPGDMTGAQPIYVIEQMQPVKVIVGVNEIHFPSVKQGMPVKVKIDVYGEEEFAGKVHLIHPSIDPSNRTFQVEVTIPNADNRVRPGMFARVSFNFGVAKRVVVPDQAIVKQTGSGNRYVYVLHDDSTVSFDQVQLGVRLEHNYELISGVESGAQVVIVGQSRLADGVKVQVANSTATPAAEADTTATK